MNLSEFITKLFNRYKSTAPDIDDKKEEITSILISKCEKIDFQKLLDLIAKESESDFLPAGGKISEWARRCYKTEYKKSGKWLHVKVFNPIYNAVVNTDVFPAGTSERAILNTYKKRFGGDGWRIVEVC